MFSLMVHNNFVLFLSEEVFVSHLMILTDKQQFWLTEEWFNVVILF